MSTLLLRNLTSASNRMLSALIQLPTNRRIENLKDELENLRRRCHIMSLLYDKNVISVAGLQGVGKSTLLSELYEFTKENTPFIENQGQGETLPILVSECQNPGKYFTHRVIEEEGILKIDIEEVSREKFLEKSHKYEKGDLLLEVTVPYKVFNDESRSFLLLPGFQSGSDYLKDLTYSALRSSNNCLVLFYQAKYAHKNNQELINTLNQEFKDSSPIMIITWSDTEELNIELANRVKTDLQITETDRVIRTGIPGPEGWRKSLIDSVQKYSIPQSDMIDVKKKNLKNLVDSYNSIISKIQTELRNLNVDRSNREYEQVRNILKVMQAEREKIRDILKENLEHTYNIYFNQIKSAIEDKIINEYKGLKGFGKNIGEFFTNNLEVRKNFEKLINSCIEEHNKKATIDSQYTLVLNKVINDIMSDHKIVMGLPTDLENGTNQKLLLYGSNDVPQNIKSETLNDIYLILNPDIKSRDFSADLIFSVKLLPALALESYRMAKILNEGKNNLNLAIENNRDLIQMYKENMREIGIGVGVLFGLDIIEGDGIDLFGLLQHNANNTAVATAAATASFNWALAAIAVTVISVYVIDQLKKSVDKKDNVARLTINHLKDYTLQKILSEFDTRMKRFEDIISDCLIRRYGLAEEYSSIQNCYHNLTDLIYINREIEELARVNNA